METLIIALIAGFGFIITYHTYGKCLGRKIFRLSQERWLLLSMGVAAILLGLWIIVEALSLLRKTPQYTPQKS
ncbi:MAG: hypothetical protein HOC27_08475 [Phycisphaerae bacterium]|jgi:hypothetical protein|nr:hypothetical protein [Phycisphaerae bacterium]